MKLKNLVHRDNLKMIENKAYLSGETGVIVATEVEKDLFEVEIRY